MRVLSWLRRRPWVAAAGLVVGILLAIVALSRRTSPVDQAFTVVVTRGTLIPRLTSSGILRPVQSITYRSPLGGRDTEVIFLVAEGTRVIEGDLLVRLDSGDLEQDFERATQERRQVQVDLQVADIDRQQAQATLESVTDGEGAIGVEEATTRLQLAEKKVARFQEEVAGLEPLMERGYITRDEYRRAADALEQAEEELSLARRRADVLVELTYPQERRRAELLRAQKEAQYENVRARAQDVDTRLQRLALQIEACSLYARRPGLVVYEEYLAASPRRKVRLGDRVTGSQGLVTIPDVDRMVVETSVTEADVHRVHTGQAVVVRLEAFPGLQLAGRVTVIGTLARSSANRPFDDKRFDVVVELDPTGADLRPEMTARADILLGERPHALLVPVNAVFERDGQFVAHVVGRLGLETRSVELGETDDDMVEILDGLAEGEQVSLMDAVLPQPIRPSPAASSLDPSSQPNPVKGGGS